MFLGEVSFFSDSKSATTVKSCSAQGTDLILWPKALMQKGAQRQGQNHLATAFQKFPSLLAVNLAKQAEAYSLMTR